MNALPFLGLAVFLKLTWVVLLKHTCRHRSAETDIGGYGRYPRSLPLDNLPKVTMQPEDTLHFQMESNHNHADAEWEALYPGGGLVYLGEPRRPFMPSMFHQLRCLDIIRRTIVGAEIDPDLLTGNTVALTHHCVNYLRQMVLCRTDLDREVVIGKGKPEVYPDLYVCRDWTVVYQEVEMNQRKNAPSSSCECSI